MNLLSMVKTYNLKSFFQLLYAEQNKSSRCQSFNDVSPYIKQIIPALIKRTASIKMCSGDKAIAERSFNNVCTALSLCTVHRILVFASINTVAKNKRKGSFDLVVSLRICVICVLALRLILRKVKKLNARCRVSNPLVRLKLIAIMS